MHKKIPKICTGCRVSEVKIYLYHSTEIAKARPHSEEWQTDTSVQKQWSMSWHSFLISNLGPKKLEQDSNDFSHYLFGILPSDSCPKYFWSNSKIIGLVQNLEPKTFSVLLNFEHT